MRSFIAFLLFAGILLVPTGALAAPKPAASCQNISGVVQGYAIPSFDGDQLVGFEVFSTVVTGELAGSFLASVTVTKITPGGTIHFSGVHTMTTIAFGTLTTSDTGTLTPNGRLHNSLTIVDGGSGAFQSYGTVNLTTGFINGGYHGRICT